MRSRKRLKMIDREPPTLYRICGRGHVVLLRRDFDPCHRCESIARAKRLRRRELQAA